MNFAIIENGSLHMFDERFVRDDVNGRLYIHPTEAQLRECGYKKFIKAECTLEEKDGYCIVSRYAEDSDTITQVWEYEEIGVIGDELS